MKLSFSEHISGISTRLSPALLGARERTVLHALCSLFPYDLAADFGFEARLSVPEPVCDFFLLIRKASKGAQILAGENPLARLSPELEMHPFWIRLSALFREWNCRNSFLNRHIHSFWLEFDYSGGDYDRVPNLFFQVDDDQAPEAGQGWSEVMERVLDQVYRILFGTGFPADLTATMRRCVEALPEGGILYQTGFMIPRKTEAIRLVLARIQRDELPGYLAQTGWQGDPDEILRIVQRYGSGFLYAFYDLTLGASVLPVLGTELFFRQNRQPQWEAGWHKVFDLLQSDRLMLEEKREGLVQFCGRKTVTQLFPVSYYCGINHLKLVSRPGKPPEGKAYFGTMIVTPG